MTLEDLPGHLYEQFARVGQALADPTRLRILNLLCQSERSVDDLADRLGHSAANTSAHLKVLQQAHLVDRRKEGRRVYYSIAGEQGLRLWLSLRDMGLQELPEVREAMRAHASDPAPLPDLQGEELLEKVRRGEVVLLDLRPEEEYASGRIPGARSIPYGELEARLDELDPGLSVVAYCRGPYCVAAIRGIEFLRGKGLDAVRLSGGIAEWRAAGRQVEVGQESETESRAS